MYKFVTREYANPLNDEHVALTSTHRQLKTAAVAIMKKESFLFAPGNSQHLACLLFTMVIAVVPNTLVPRTKRTTTSTTQSILGQMLLAGILAVGYVVCQSLCIRRKLFEVDNAQFEKWRNRLIINPHVQAAKLFNQLLLLQPNYILPVNKAPTEFKDTVDSAEVLNDVSPSVQQPYGPVTAKEAYNEAVSEFAHTHETILGELELNFGAKAIDEKRYEDAVEHFTTGAKLSSPGSMFNLALCYELGLGTSMDYTKAAKYYKRAADKGHADAMYNLGVFHAQGKGGLEFNLNISRQLFTEAAKKGQTEALKALQLERSFKKRPNLEHNKKYSLEVKTLNSSVENNVVRKLMNYNNYLMKDLNDQTIESDQYINSYDSSIDSQSPTDMFLDLIGVHERSAMHLLSAGESGP